MRGLLSVVTGEGTSFTGDRGSGGFEDSKLRMAAPDLELLVCLVGVV